MKKQFPGQFPQSKADISKLWSSCTFVMDANILLNLYRYSDSTRNEFLRVLESIKDRVWLPHRAAEEFFANRLSVIGQQEKAYDVTVSTITSLEKDLENARQHPFVAERTMKKVRGVFDQLRKELEDNKKVHTKRITSDPIKTSIAKIFSNRVGASYESERLAEILLEGEARYAEKMPPGFRDESKKDDSGQQSNKCRKYGDLLVWFQLLDRANEQASSMILVTDDKKDDWWEIFKGRTIGPRPELVKEFKTKTQQAFHMYQADRFLEFANEYLEQKVDETALSEIREVRQRDIEVHRAQLRRQERELMRHVEYDSLSSRIHDLKKQRAALANRRDEIMHHHTMMQDSMLSDFADAERRDAQSSFFHEINQIEAELNQTTKEMRELEISRKNFRQNQRIIEQEHRAYRDNAR